MADVKWIKITTDIFDDEKILLIESLPDAYAIIVVWFKLLCLAGKMNNSGVFVMNNQIAYTDKMLATIFRMKESTVQLALQTFQQFGMVEIIDGVITIPNWGKHQNLDQLERKRSTQREYMREYRAKQKLLAGDSSGEQACNPDGKADCKADCKANCKANVSRPDIDKEGDTEGEKERIGASPFSAPKPSKPIKHKYGEYQNVLLTDEEMEKLKAEYPDWSEKIENMSIYLESKGAKYKSHYATIRSWARKDAAERPKYKSASLNPLDNIRREDYDNGTQVPW